MKTFITIALSIALFIPNTFAGTIVVRKITNIGTYSDNRTALVKEIDEVSDEMNRIKSAPPMYDPRGKIDPFAIPVEDAPIISRKERKYNGPETPLTQYALSEMVLTGIVRTSKVANAYFLTPASDKCIRGRVGDFIGKTGARIELINTGIVGLSDGTSLLLNQ